ncbi:hypothetical protein GCM10010398_68390 [Streptomyces fimbriatus]
MSTGLSGPGILKGSTRAHEGQLPPVFASHWTYSSRANRAHLQKRHTKAVIPEKKDRAANRKKRGSRGGRPVSHDTDLYKERNTVEHLINRLKD